MSNETSWVMVKELNMDYLGARTKNPETGRDVVIAAIIHKSQRVKGRQVVLRLLDKRTGMAELHNFKPNVLVQIDTTPYELSPKKKEK